jgi:arginyl-tRNA synthetase
VLRLDLTRLVQASVDRLVASGRLPSGLPAVELQDTKDPAHGDFATNFAMVASKPAGLNPRALAELLQAELEGSRAEGRGLNEGPDPRPSSLDPLDSVDIAGPGFINLRLNPEYVASYVPAILSLDPAQFAARAAEATVEKHRINVEFVSVNPNGPITVGSGRGAAFGSTLASVLEAAGHTVHREYYINDGVNSEQMRLFAESVKAIVEGRPVPENGYKGDYVSDVAQKLAPVSLAQEQAVDKDLDRDDDFSLANAVLKQLVSDVCERGAKRILMTRGEFSLGDGSIGDAYEIYIEPDEVPLGVIPSEIGEDIQRSLAAVSPVSYRELSSDGLLTANIKANSQVLEVRIDRSRWAATRSYALEIESGQTGISWYQRESQALMLTAQRSDLAAFGTTFDTWFSEQSLHDAGVVESEIAALIPKGAADDRPVRHKLKLAKGGVIEDVEVEVQASEDEEATNDERGTSNFEEDQEIENRKSKIENQATLWLRSTKFGDDMDRVIRRKDGRLTYIASDVAYHKDKFNRPPNADKLITVLGPDHHGYIGRLHAVLAAVEMDEPGTSNLEHRGSKFPVPSSTEDLTEVDSKLYASPEERDACLAALEKARRELDVVIFQLVRFVKDGKPAPMRKRDGNIYALIDLIDEIGKKVKPEAPLEEQRKSGKDVARFFYLMRSHDTTFDFDLDLAEKQSDDNPVFYVQYAHARICSVLRKAQEAGLSIPQDSSEIDRKARAWLAHSKETALIKKILDLPHEVSRCAEDYGVHRLTTYAIELARTYHHFYDACRVIQPEEPELSEARLALCEVTKTALRATLDLLGIEAPESM